MSNPVTHSRPQCLFIARGCIARSLSNNGNIILCWFMFKSRFSCHFLFRPPCILWAHCIIVSILILQFYMYLASTVKPVARVVHVDGPPFIYPCTWLVCKPLMMMTMRQKPLNVYCYVLSRSNSEEHKKEDVGQAVRSKV